MAKTYEIRVSILGIEPEIWRTIKISSEATFFDLHETIQTTLGWRDQFLFEFENDDFLIGEPDIDGIEEPDEDLIDANEIQLDQVFKAVGDEIGYCYDFDDYWEASVELLAESDDAIPHPLCIGGAQHGPLEECGGVEAYIDLMEVARNIDHERYEDLQEWLDGQSFHPDTFDIDQINEVLAASV